MTIVTASKAISVGKYSTSYRIRLCWRSNELFYLFEFLYWNERIMWVFAATKFPFISIQKFSITCWIFSNTYCFWNRYNGHCQSRIFLLEIRIFLCMHFTLFLCRMVAYPATRDYFSDSSLPLSFLFIESKEVWYDY